jgi:4-methyl-5(b-hydroxyethyl)-thiazole monophosphate biosynthesis
LLFLADGFEEIEAVSTIDVLRRGEVELLTVSIHPGRTGVTGAHGVTINADVTMESLPAGDAACLVFPGGMPGAENLGAHAALLDLAQHHMDRGGLIAAICAAPAMVLSKLLFPRPFNMTCYPGYESYLVVHRLSRSGVVTDANLVTAKGPAFAIPFALEVLKNLRGQEQATTVASGLLL